MQPQLSFAFRFLFVSGLLSSIACGKGPDGRFSEAGVAVDAPAAATDASDASVFFQDVAPLAVCKLGNYSGLAKGSIIVPLMSSTPLTGEATVSFSLKEQREQSEFAEISAGSLSGKACDQGGTTCFDYSADLTGTLDCGSGTLKDGKLSNGKVIVPSFGTFSFQGTVGADFDSTTSKFVKGTMNLAGDFGSTGTGTWGADWIGP